MHFWRYILEIGLHQERRNGAVFFWATLYILIYVFRYHLPSPPPLSLPSLSFLSLSLSLLSPPFPSP